MEDGIADASDRLDVVEGEVEGKADAEHDHDNRYYPIGFVDFLLGDKADKLVAVNSQSGTSYTLDTSDAGKVVEMTSSSANTVTVPTNADEAFPTGSIIEVCQMGSGQTTIAAAPGVTLRAPRGAKLAVRYASASLRKRDTNEWVLTGDVTE